MHMQQEPHRYVCFREVPWIQYRQSTTTNEFQAQLYHIENVHLQLADSEAQTARSTHRRSMLAK